MENIKWNSNMNQPDNFCQTAAIFCNAINHDGLKKNIRKIEKNKIFLITVGYINFELKLVSGTAIALT